MYDARAVANVMLAFADNDGVRLSNLKLQKLLYLAHGYLLVAHGRPLVKDGFEAWAYGPVSRTAYHAFKQFDDLPITNRARRFDPVKGSYEDIGVDVDEIAVFAIEEVVRVFGGWPEFELVEFTHQPGSPWRITVDEAQTAANVGMVIDDALIRGAFEGTTELERCNDEIES
jgi:uncharacterized phage-associated protein